MTGARWPRVKEILYDALQLSVDERTAFVKQACGDDEELWDELTSLLGAEADLDGFLEPTESAVGALSLLAAKHGDGIEPDYIGVVFAQRYRAERVLGRGSSGLVYEAVDTLMAEPVAIKVWHTGARAAPDRDRRERAALRWLRLPGVIHILDEGEHDGAPFIVTPLVDGEPFPGREGPLPWLDIADAVANLLRIVGQIHARDIVHGDLKPANILMDADGRPVVLDLGTSRGEASRDEVEGREGTPAYWAPEQIEGAGVATPASDLYAIGVMVYEALAGHEPHPAEDVVTLIEKRRSRPPISLPQRVPAKVAAFVMHLLAHDPAARPATCEDAVAELEGSLPPLVELDQFAWLGDPAVVDALCRASEGGRGMDLAGPKGSGRGRFLAEAAQRLRDAGQTVIEIPADAATAAGVSIIEAGRTGAVLVVYDETKLDEASRAALQDARTKTSVLAGVAANKPGAHKLVAREETELRPLFCGPDAILHLREDGAHELFARTAGWPGRVLSELRQWVRSGQAQVVDGCVRVERRTLDAMRLLRTEEPALVALAQSVSKPKGDSVQELVTCALDYHGRGQVARARSLLRTGLAHARSVGAREAEFQFLSSLVHCSASSVDAVENAVYELERSRVMTRRMEQLTKLAYAMLARARGQYLRAFQLYEALGELADPEEGVRQRDRVLASQQLGDLEARVVRGYMAWARRSGTQYFSRYVRAFFLYRRCRFDRAARQFEFAVRAASSRRDHIIGQLGLGGALMDAGRFDQARTVFDACLDEVVPLRLADLEIRVIQNFVECEARQDRVLDMEPETLDAMREAVPASYAMVALSMAGVALRAHEHDRAREWTTRVESLVRRWITPELRQQVQAVGVAAGEAMEEEDARAIAGSAANMRLPAVGAQVIALLGSRFPSIRREHASTVRTQVTYVPRKYHAVRREILSMNECLSWMGMEP